MANDQSWITLQGFTAIVGALAGVLALLVLLAPWTPYHLGENKERLLLLFGAIVEASSVVLVCRICSPISRPSGNNDHHTSQRIPNSVLATTAMMSVAMFLLLWIWEPPTRQQMARQILNFRGVSVTRDNYKMSLEIGDWGAVDLFHDVGFDTSSAFTWLGDPAETDSRIPSVFMLLHQKDEHKEMKLRRTLTALADPLSQQALPWNSRDAANRRVLLIDQPIPLKDAGFETRFTNVPGVSPPALQRLLTSDGLSLLGYSVLWNNREAVQELLYLNASLAAATVPLARAGGLPQHSHLLAVDPFLYVLNIDANDGDLAGLNGSNEQHSLVSELRNQGYHPSWFSAPDDVHSERCSSGPWSNVDPSLKYQRFLGYRQVAGEYALAEFALESCRFSNHTTQSDGQMNYAFLRVGDENSISNGAARAVVRIVEPAPL